MRQRPTVAKPSIFRRRLQKGIVLSLVALVLLEWGGVPHLRLATNYRLAGSTRYFDHSRYLSPFGVREVDPALLPEELPLVVFLPPETRPSKWVRDRGARLLADIEKRLQLYQP